mmetsp:Transcript_20173/g.41876  ORF Transcript_20173/g.41876 Transcript_20173/m.41876 type:complete len:457 (+) Transcript_20173:681-2051(+)
MCSTASFDRFRIHRRLLVALEPKHHHHSHRIASGLAPHVPQETAVAASSTAAVVTSVAIVVTVVVTVIVAAPAASSASVAVGTKVVLVPSTAASSPAVVSHVVVVHLVKVGAAAPPRAASHHAVKVAGSSAAPVSGTTASGTGPGALEIDDPVAIVEVVVHSEPVLLVPPALVAEAGLELAAAVAPVASVGGSAHDLGGGSPLSHTTAAHSVHHVHAAAPRSKVVVSVAVASTGVPEVPEEAAASHALAGAFSELVHVVHILFAASVVSEHAPSSSSGAVAHHAIPHALPGSVSSTAHASPFVPAHSALEVFDLVHTGSKIFHATVHPVPAPGAINVVSVLAVDRILHGAAVLGKIDPSRETVVLPLGVLAGPVLEVAPAVVEILAVAVALFAAAAVAAVGGSSGVVAAGHPGPDDLFLFLLRGRNREWDKGGGGAKGFGGQGADCGGHGCREEQG